MSALRPGGTCPTCRAEIGWLTLCATPRCPVAVPSATRVSVFQPGERVAVSDPRKAPLP